jgi:cytochrome P450
MQSFLNNGLTQEENLSESLLMMLAGSDTTASAIRATMLCVLTSPLTYQTLRAEIDAATLSTPVVLDEEARKLVYLQAVILEGIRMHPPPGGLLPRVSPPEGDTINGIFIPGGVEIGVNTWGIMRDGDVFGPDPEMFRPERWLNIPEERYAEMARVVDLAFGSGRFKCLGRSVALMELNKIIIEVRRVHPLTFNG